MCCLELEKQTEGKSEVFCSSCYQTTLAFTNSHYNHAFGQVANLFNTVILNIQGHAVMFVQEYANPFFGKQIMNI